MLQCSLCQPSFPQRLEVVSGQRQESQVPALLWRLKRLAGSQKIPVSGIPKLEVLNTDLPPSLG